MTLGKSVAACVAAVAVGSMFGACGPTQVHCEGGSYFSDVTRGCVGIGRYREENDGAFPDGFAFDDAAQNEASTMDSAATDASDVVAPNDVGDAGSDVVPIVDPGLSAPRAIAPLSTSSVTSQRPTLRWMTSASIDGAVVEVSRTRDFAVRAHELRASGDRVRLPAALSAGVWFWRLRGRSSARNAEGTTTSPVWWFRVGARSADGDRDVSWGSELDLNGDGYGDVAIGSDQSGRVEVYYGGPSGIGASPSATLRDPSGVLGFGVALANIGDVNGDGFADLAVGAPAASSGGIMGVGTVSVFLGGASGIASPAARTLVGRSMAGDFGFSIAGAGDVNGDGYADLIVGEQAADPAGRNNAGTVDVYLGGSAGIGAVASTTVEGASPEDMFGGRVGGAGDIDADGFADIAVAALWADPAGVSRAGTVSVFRGGPSGIHAVPDQVLAGMAADDFFGSRIAGAGDVNGDGFADVALARPWAAVGGVGGSGETSIFHGSSAGLIVVPARTLNGTMSEGFGSALTVASDTNFDGYSDLIVGSSGASPGRRFQAGSVAVFRGGPTGIASSRSQTLEGRSPGDSFGCAVGTGDVNGDGFVDVSVGAMFATPGGRTIAGEVTVFSGNGSGFSTVGARILEGTSVEDSFGEAIAQ